MFVCQGASWAIGTDPAIDSLDTRLGEAGWAVTAVPAAREGARMADARPLVDAAFEAPGAPGAADVDLVTVLLGANDVCAPDVAAMTSTADYTAQLDALLSDLATRAPDAAVVLASIPAVTSVWDAANDDPEARAVWDNGLCATVLGGDDTARAAAAQRLVELDEAATATCQQHPACRTDDGAVAAVALTPAWLSDVDHFHPSPLGQAALAEAVWPAVDEALAQRGE
ncbi:hypothetical protein GCM10025875_00400 [Litorihabitans aurantiacus]|uniref:SGNH hydrolase-type esterase domain-containing protein n=1 Tax=Litorihabitans aurantiacus TaxID=1930061 RepID=A0AA37UG51_9MICO|nr:hypothetical protein GCM10025875_00400 [Litorihabitans aurantiacus]